MRNRDADIDLAQRIVFGARSMATAPTPFQLQLAKAVLAEVERNYQLDADVILHKHNSDTVWDAFQKLRLERDELHQTITNLKQDGLESNDAHEAEWQKINALRASLTLAINTLEYYGNSYIYGDGNGLSWDSALIRSDRGLFARDALLKLKEVGVET